MVQVDVIGSECECVDDPSTSSKDLLGQVIQRSESREIRRFTWQGWHCYLVCVVCVCECVFVRVW